MAASSLTQETHVISVMKNSNEEKVFLAIDNEKKNEYNDFIFKKYNEN